MDTANILPKYSKILTTQEYTAKTAIDGVKFLPLTYHRDDTGEFVELGRFDNGSLRSFQLNIAQISTSLLLPGAVKAFHLHFDQTDIWFVSPHQRLLVGLLDSRKSSPTAESTMRFILGGGVAQLLVIPAGVAHGAANPWTEPVSLTYFTDSQFNPDHPDEHRLPFDLFGKEFWQLKKG